MLLGEVASMAPSCVGGKLGGRVAATLAQLRQIKDCDDDVGVDLLRQRSRPLGR